MDLVISTEKQKKIALQKEQSDDEETQTKQLDDSRSESGNDQTKEDKTVTVKKAGKVKKSQKIVEISAKSKRFVLLSIIKKNCWQ